MVDIGVPLKDLAIQHPGRVSGLWYQLSRTPKANGAAYVANRLYLVPFFVTEPITIDQLGIRISTLAAAGNIKGGIWASDPTTKKATGAPLISFGDQSTAATGVFAIDVTNTVLPPGLYYMGTVADNSTVVMSTAAGTNWLVGTTALSNAMFGAGVDTCGHYVSHTYANALPDLTAGSFTDFGGGFGACFAFKAA